MSRKTWAGYSAESMNGSCATRMGDMRKVANPDLYVVEDHLQSFQSYQNYLDDRDLWLARCISESNGRGTEGKK